MFFRNVTKDKTWRIERKTVTFNSSGNLSVPFGKSSFNIYGQGVPGNSPVPGNPTPASPGNPTGNFNPPYPVGSNPPEPYPGGENPNPPNPPTPGNPGTSTVYYYNTLVHVVGPQTSNCIAAFGNEWQGNPSPLSSPATSNWPGFILGNVLASNSANYNETLKPGTSNPVDSPGEGFRGGTGTFYINAIAEPCGIGLYYTYDYTSPGSPANNPVPGNPTPPTPYPGGENPGNPIIAPGNENTNPPTPNPPNPSSSGNAGSPFSVLGVTFPGGPIGGNAPAVSGTPVFLPTVGPNETNLSITVPSGGSVNITFD